MTGALLHLDAACVQRFVISGGLLYGSLSQQRVQAALDDPDTAYARLAAPLGLPEFSARAEEPPRTGFLARVPAVEAVCVVAHGDVEGTDEISVAGDLRQVAAHGRASTARTGGGPGSPGPA